MTKQSEMNQSVNLVCQQYNLLTDTCLISTTFNYELNSNTQYYAKYGIIIPQYLHKAAAKRQAQFIAGRFCARQALVELSAVIDIPTKNDDGSSRWAKGYTGSITHSHYQAMAMVASQDKYLGVGIDLEPLITKSNLATLSTKILTKAELARFNTDIANNMSFVVTLIFSLKESLFKALYPLVQTRFYFQDAQVISFDINGLDTNGLDISGVARMRLVSCLNEKWQAGCEIKAVFKCLDNCILTVTYIAAD